MNKKLYKVIALFTIVGSAYFGYDYYKLNKGLTPEEIAEAEFQKKREKTLRGEAKMDRPDAFQEFQRGIRQRENEVLPGYTFNYRINELSKLEKNQYFARSSSEENGVIAYTERGPGNVPGRTRGLLNLPGDPSNNSWLAGASGGGIWKTSDGGQSWQNVSPELPTLAVSSLAMSEVDPNIIYAGTGEYIASAGTAIEGDGVFKSTDGGDTWTQLPSTTNSTDFISITRVIVDPNDPDVVLVCSAPNTWDRAFNSTIMKSTDGGENWQRVFNVESGGAIEQLIADPSNFNILYAAQNRVGVLKSTDAGETWQLSNSGMFPSGRLEIAIAPSNTSKIYASAVGNENGTGSDLYMSDDGGSSWQLVQVQINDVDIDFFNGQGWYDNTILVNPFDENEIYFGGVSLFRGIVENGTVNLGFYEIINETTFVEFTNFGASNAGGTLEVGANAFETDVEIRFGSGQSQFAHRFTVPANGGSLGDGGRGVPDSEYAYQDYVEVPFEVWEVDNDGLDVRQLMVSFRDQQRDGSFNLNPTDNDELLNSREYIYIHDIDYSEAASTIVTNDGGHVLENFFFIWPNLVAGNNWDPNNLPNEKIKLFFSDRFLLESATQAVVDGRGQYNNFNNNVHVDMHNMLALVDNPAQEEFRVLLSNDGGVYVSSSSGAPGVTNNSWDFASVGYNTSQFYGADKKPGEDQYIGGMQDNGTWFSTVASDATTDYNFAIGGDGFEVLWHPLEPNKMIGGSQFNGFRRTLNGGATWQNATAGLSADNNYPFISKLAHSKDLPDIIYTVSSAGVHKSENFGGFWTLTPIESNWGGGSTFLDVEVSRANANVVWAGSGMSGARNIHVSTDQGQSFQATNNFVAPQGLGNISRLASHPLEEETAYALFSFAKGPKVLRTQDLGQTWEELSGFGDGEVSSNGFPDVAVYCLYVRPDNPDIIWVGSEIGIIESLDNGLTWHLLDEFINASVWDMKGQDNQIVIATHGRGIWTAELATDQNSGISPSKIIGVTQRPNKKINLISQSEFEFDSVEFYIDNNRFKTAYDVLPGERIDIINFTGLGIYKAYTISYTGGAPFQSSAFNFQPLPIKDPEVSYGTNFAVFNSPEFDLDNFIRTELGSWNVSLQSPHPYPNDVELVNTLLVPIIVSESNGLFYYRDIALTEPDNDFVFVQATKDGITWEDLQSPYSAAKSAEWLSAFNNNESGTPALYEENNLDLNQSFNDQDTILVRFMLTSNETVNGWGWSIDDLYIQQQPTSVAKELSKEELNIYPNPARNIVNIKTKLNGETTTIQLFSLNGGLVSKGNYVVRNGEIKMDISTIRSGTYLMKIGTGTTFRKLIITD